MRLRKFWALFLVLSMLVSMIPTTAFAVETGSEPSGGIEVPAVVNPDNLFLDKTAELTDDGTYTIDLEAYATGQETTWVKPADIVLVLDHSGSMRTPVGAPEVLKSDTLYEGEGAFAYTELDTTLGQHTGYYVAQSQSSKTWFVVRYDAAETKWYIYSVPSTESIVGINEGDWTEHTQTQSWTVDDIAAGTNDAGKFTALKFYKSQYAVLYDAVKDFVNDLKATGAEHRVAIIGFAASAGDGSRVYVGGDEPAIKSYDAMYHENTSDARRTELYQKALKNVQDADQYDLLLNSIEAIETNYSYTCPSGGLKMAADLLAANEADPAERDRIVVLFTDGIPNAVIGEAEGTELTDEKVLQIRDEIVSTAAAAKAQGATVYSISTTTLGEGADRTFLSYVSSDYPDATDYENPGTVIDPVKYTSEIDSADALTTIFEQVTQSTVASSVELNASAILKDVMADGFAMTSNTTITVSVVPGSVSEENKDLTANQLTSDKITWGEPQQVLTFDYASDEKKGSGKVTVGDGTTMTLTADASEDGVVTVSGFNYAKQFVCYGHDGYKLVVSINCVEAADDVATGALVETNLGTSGIYESAKSDADDDGTLGEIQAAFPIPNTYLTSKTYYLDYTGKITIDPKDFLMTGESINADGDGYHFFGTPGTTAYAQYGKVTVNEDGTITYELADNEWENDDVFYLFGTTEDPTVTGATANANGNMWAKITIVPPSDVRGELYVDKTATLEDDGTYTIDLEAYATGTPVMATMANGMPLDVVLVLDQSGSLHKGNYGGSLSVLKESVTEFVESLKANGAAYGVDHRISVCGFGSRDKQGPSALSGKGYTFAGTDQDNAWVNTGLFVNGEFRDYATVNYTRITSPDQINNSKYYTGKLDADKDGIDDYVRLIYHVGYSAWRYWNDEVNYIIVNGNEASDNNELLLAVEGLEVYDYGENTVQLDDADYAASWESIASGANGQGDINPDILKTIDHLAANGATATFYGLKMASRMLENAPNDGIQRKKVVVVFTDGEPGYSGYVRGDGDAALSEVMKIKETGVEVFSVGVYDSAAEGRVNTFMNQLSSNYQSHSFATEPTRIDVSQILVNDTSGTTNLCHDIADGYSGLSPYYKKVGDDYWPVLISWKAVDSLYYVSYITDTGEVVLGGGAKADLPDIAGDVYMLAEHEINADRTTDYYKYASDINELSALFDDIASEATSTSSQVALGVDAILKDVMADGFKLTDKTTITVSVVPGSVSEENKDLTGDQLTADKITWGDAQQVLTFNYADAKEGSGKVVVSGAADQTEMTLTAKVNENGEITVTGFNYADPTDNYKDNAQYIAYDHPGSKLQVTITGVEADKDIVTDSTTVTNQGTSGIYEGPERDADGDGEKGEMQASFPIPTTYLTSKTYYLDYTGSITIDPEDFLMTVNGVNADPDGYHYFGEPGTKIETEYGEVTVNEDGSITYTLTKNNWENPDIFYLFGTTNDPTVTGATANENGNMWSKIIIIPPEDIRGNLYVDKKATLEDNGTYTIDLEAYATGTPVTTSIIDGVPLDVVLVLDQSGSLFSGDGGGSLAALKSSVTTFVEALKTNGEAFGVNHRVAVCGFASGAKQGASGIVEHGLSYANNNQDNAWVNTGLFVNGQFKDYGTLEYIPVESVEDIVSGKYYAVECDPDEDGIYEIVRAYVSSGVWVVTSGTPDGQKKYTLASETKDEEGNVIATANENLFNNYKVYTVGASSNLLTDADYAASWENIADGENGQGNINPDITKTIDSLAASGATATFYGLKMAARMMANVPDDGIERKRVVIVFTDGVPGYNGYTKGDGDAALSEVMKIKEDGTEVYAVGIYKASSAASVEAFMNQLSSNYTSHSFAEEATIMDMNAADSILKLSRAIDGSYYGISPYFHKVVNEDGTEEFWPISVYYDPTVDANLYHAAYITDDAEIEIASGKKDEIPGKVGDVYMLAEPEVNTHPDADYYKYSSTISELTAIFKAITTEATTFASETALGVDAILKDVMASNFKLTDNTTITVSVVPGSVSAEYEDLPADELTKDKITWGEPQTVLTMDYPAELEKSGNVVVNGAADQTEMTLTATASADGVITVTGYNYAAPMDSNKINAQYICVGHPGSKLLVTITGVEATTDVVTDDVTATNQGTSGIYEPEDSDADGDGETGEIQASFPIPTTYLTSKVYVVDYAKKMTINPSDFKMTIGAESLDVDGYNYFAPAMTEITEKYGKVAVENGEVSYTPTNTNWDGYDTFFVFGTTDDGVVTDATANENGNMWAKVKVIPANNVYYEDTFVTDTESGTAGIVYSGTWTEENTDNGQGEHAESGENTEGDNQGGVHGWEDTLADDTGYSAGSAHVSSTTGATATFTFTGTGVDIYSRTNPTTGIVIAMLYEGDSTTDDNGKNLMAKYTLMVDNLAASGDYYQIPTLSLCKIPAKDADGKIIVDDEGNAVMVDLPHGTYTVKIIVSKASADQTGEERFLYYLDGIRVYNPIQNLEDDGTVGGAYGEEEMNATFVEIRDELLDAGSFSAENEDSAGPVFIDRITAEDGEHTDNTETFEIGTYKVFGPKNEVYLSANQMIAFAVEYREGAHYHIGMKSLTGVPAAVSVSAKDNIMATLNIAHTTDLYYEVVPAWTDTEGKYLTDEAGNRIGIIMVQADFMNSDFAMDENGEWITDENGDLTYEGSILALTKLKVTGPEEAAFTFATVRNVDLLRYVEEIAGRNAAEPEKPGKDELLIPMKPGKPGVILENPDFDQWDDNDSKRPPIWGKVKQLFDRLRDWMRP